MEISEDWRYLLLEFGAGKMHGSRTLDRLKSSESLTRCPIQDSTAAVQMGGDGNLNEGFCHRFGD